MNSPILRSLSVQITAPPSPQEIENTLDFVSSDESLDRYGEIICASGWKLESYLKNPVFQNSHQYGDILHTLGRALITEVRTSDERSDSRSSSVTSDPRSDAPTLSRSSFLFQRIEFAVDANPIANLAYKLYKGGFLRALSVGFRPIRWLDGDKLQNTARDLVGVSPLAERTQRDSNGEDGLDEQVQLSESSDHGPQCRRKYLEQELLEVSAVSIPANPNALALALKSGAVDRSTLRDISDLCRQTLATPPSPGEAASMLSSHPSTQSLQHSTSSLSTLTTATIEPQNRKPTFGKIENLAITLHLIADLLKR